MGKQPLSEENTASLEASAAYVEQHKVFQLFEGLLQDLIVHKPSDPIDHMINCLRTPSVPRVILMGPPAADVRSQCMVLEQKMGVNHINVQDLWRELSKAGSEAGEKAKVFVDSGSDIPTELLLTMLQEKLTGPECLVNGWVLEGFPGTRAEAQGMLAAGLLPTTLVHLELSDDEVVRRLTGRRVDVEGNEVYHVDDRPPPDEAIAARLVHRPDDMPDRVAERLSTYRGDAASVLPLFASVTKTVDATLAHSELAAAIQPLVSSQMPSRAPRGCPRVLLLGGPGSRSLELAQAAARRHGVVCVAARELLHQAMLSGSPAGKKIAPFLKNGFPEEVPDELVAPLVLERLAKDDVRKSGFVLQGFPANAKQAKMLLKGKVWVRHVVLLELSAAEARSALTGIRFDPYDGAEYHEDTHWPSDPVVQARLVQHPHHAPTIVAQAQQSWEGRKKALTAAFPQLLVEEAAPAKRSLLALEERLAHCF